MDENGNVIFREEQRFRQVWMWGIVIIPSVIMWRGFILQLFYGIPAGNSPASDAVTIIAWVLIGLVLPLFIYVNRLITEVRRDDLYIRFFPYHMAFRKILWREIKSFEERTYRPLREYGGWGIRRGFGGWAYNVSGKRGVQLELMSGKRLLIGSQKPGEIVEAILSVKGE